MWKLSFVMLLLAVAAAQAGHVDEDRLSKVKAAVSKLRATRSNGHHTGVVRRHAELTPMAYEEQIEAFLEQLKQMMREPMALLGNRTLDPLEVAGPININIDNDMIALAGNVSNIRVDKLSTFETVSASFSIVGFKLSVVVHFEEIFASGEYNLDGALMSGLLLVYGQGPFTISVQNSTFSIDIALKSTSENVPYIDQLIIDYDIPIVQTNFTGLLGGGDLSDVTNEIISDLVPQILDNQKDNILGAIVPVIVDAVNEAISGYTLNDIICKVVGVFC
ncbi:uncharacterized protein LOC126149112 [Schistocerca cancellata]|uniref:uncharacterized protein LOC126149112 n=1 Tax=Schistocerca cancellata TaxID=274614 RepID=UPI0021190F06|nr:uncharacterized protein LOC126149112 [Schistocerca cancellata]